MIKTIPILMLCALLVLGLKRQAFADGYDITFNDPAGDTGFGQINVQFANGYLQAESGYLNVTGGLAIGNWTLYTAGGSTPYPGYIYSPGGAYIYNNAVYPSGQNPQYPGTNVLIDYYGLLFTGTNSNELNLWGNADGTYTLGGNIGGWQNFNVIN